MIVLSNFNFRSKLYFESTVDKCQYCLGDALERCKLEHPEWFTKKRWEIKSGCDRKVEGYCLDRVVVVPCFVVRQCDDYDTWDEYLICSMHMHLIADKLGGS